MPIIYFHSTPCFCGLFLFPKTQHRLPNVIATFCVRRISTLRDGADFCIRRKKGGLATSLSLFLAHILRCKMRGRGKLKEPVCLPVFSPFVCSMFCDDKRETCSKSKRRKEEKEEGRNEENEVGR